MNKAVFQRVRYITKVLAREGMGYIVDQLQLRTHLPWVHRFKQTKFRKKVSKPERIRHILEELGASYVKLGQLLSVRPDLVPHEYCKEFRKLQDQVRQLSFKQVKHVIEQELNKPLSHVFSSFNQKPIGSASVAQVHKAILKNGKHVVVKVQRPSVAQRFTADIDVMYFLAHKMKIHIRPKQFDPVEIVKEFEHYTENELDFMIEADNVDKFEKQFEENVHVKIPHCYREHSTHKIITLEYVHGARLSNLIRKNKIHTPNAITQNILELGLKQIFRMSIFHADLHPGNIIVMRDGRIALLDFGITGSLLPAIREQSIKMYLSLMDKDVKAAEEALLAVGDVPEYTNRRAFRKEIREVIEEWHRGSTRGKRVTHQMHKLLDVCTKHQIALPKDMVMLAKALVTMEATCLEVDPDFDFVESSKPYLVQVLESEFRSELNLREMLKKSLSLKRFVEEFPRQVLNTLHTFEEGNFRIDIDDSDIKTIGTRLYLSSDRLSLALIAGSFVIAGGLILQTNIPPLLWGYSILSIAAFAMAFGVATWLLRDYMSKA
ncbi:MAG: ABC1 kinase family protein [Candidatus Nanoarchaeia archaeon]